MITKKIAALVVAFCLVFTVLPSFGFGVSMDTVYAATDAMSAIKSALDSSYKKSSTSLTSDGTIGIPVDITVYYDSATHGTAKAGYGKTKIVLYVVNTPTERVGVDSDVTIIKSMLNRGYIVGVLDYKNNAKAVAPNLDFSIQALYIKFRAGNYFTHSTTPSGAYHDSFVVPAGHNVSPSLTFWSADKHGADGTLEKIVNVWNNDFRAVKGNSKVYWLDSSGNKKKTAKAFDGTSPVWYNASGAEVSSSSSDAKYTKVKWTVAEDIYDCVNPDGSKLDLDMNMHVIYPTASSTSTYQAPVIALASSSGYLGDVSATADRSHFHGFLFDGYAGVIFDYFYVPMATDNSFGYFDGKTNSNSRSGNQMTYAVHTYNDKLINTAAMRYIRYLSYTKAEMNFKEKGIGVFGNSKGGWATALGLKSLNTYLDKSAYSSTDAYKKAIEEKVTSLTSKYVFPGHYSETRYANGKTADDSIGYIDGGEMQPWLTYNNNEILSGANMVYACCGSSEEDIEEGHSPMFASLNMADQYNSGYGASVSFINICRYHDIPALYYKSPVGHTFASGPDEIYGVDTYMGFRDYANYHLKGDAVKVAYSEPMNGGADIPVNDNLVVKFTGPVSADEVKKVSVAASDDVAVTGMWKSAFGNTEWTFIPDCLKGGTKYTLTVPAGIKGDNGVAATESYSVSFTTVADTNYQASSLVKGERGTYFTVTVPDTSGITSYVPNQFMARFRVENDAANVAEIYAVTNYNAENPDASTIGNKLGYKNLKGSGVYSIDVTEYVSSLGAGSTATFLIKPKNTAGQTVVYEHNFETDLGDIETGNDRTDNKIASNTEYSLTTAPDGTKALSLAAKTNAGTYVDEEFYKNTSTVFTNNVLLKIGNIGVDDYGRKFKVTIPVYDTVSRRVLLLMNGCTNSSNKIIDLHRTFVPLRSEKNAWKNLEMYHTVYETDYGTIGYQRKSLSFNISPHGNSDDPDSPIYVKGIKVEEIITDIDVTGASLSSSSTSSFPYKAPESTKPFAIYNGNTKLAEYDSYKAALTAYEYGQTVKLQRNYILTNADRYEGFATSTKAVRADGNNEFVIDLNGYTIDCQYTSGALIWAKATSASIPLTHVRVVNGAICLDRGAYVSYDNSTTAGAGKEFKVDTTNVTFFTKPKAMEKNLMSDPTITSGTTVVTNMNFMRCNWVVLDDNLADQQVQLFPASTSADLTLKYSVAGGRITLSTFNKLSICGDNSKVVFKQGSDGNYTRFTMPKSTTPSDATYKNESGDFVSLKSVSETDSHINYTLSTNVNSTKYGVIPNQYSSATDYPWAVFDGKGNFVTATDDLGTDNDTTSAFCAMSNKGSGAVILLRRDLTYTQTNTYWNLGAAVGNYTVDLNGKTITCASSSGFLFSIQGKGTGEALNMNIKNGKIYTSKPILRYEALNAEKTANFTFDGVTIGSVSDASSKNILVLTYVNANATKKTTAKITLNNCTFDITGLGLTAEKRVFNISESKGMVEAEVVVNGGSMVVDANSAPYTKLMLTEAGSSVKFGTYNNDYFKITMPTGATTSFFDYTYTGTDGSTLSLLKSTTGTSTTTYELGSLITPYGTIPETYASLQDYPFATFDAQGNFLNAAPIFAADSGSTNSAITNVAKQTSGEWVIFLRRDYTYNESKFNNLSFVYGTLTLDLNGKTISCTQTHDSGMFTAQSKRGVDSDIIIKNGEFKLLKKPVITYAIYGTSNGVKDFNFTFDNVKFGFLSGATTSSVIANYNGTSGDANYLAEFGGKITLNNCTFDTKTNAPSTTPTLFAAGNADNYLVNTVEVVGGKATMPAFNLATFIAENNAKSSVTLKPNSKGEYLTIVLPTTAAAPDHSFIVETADGEATYTETSTAGTYKLAPSIETKYGNIPARYESVSKYPLAVFDKNGKFETATALFGVDSDATSALTSAKGDGDVIMLRGDYTYNPSAVYNNLSQINGTITLDLNGYTIRCASEKWPLFKAQAKTPYSSKIVIKDGTIRAGSKPLIEFASWVSSTTTSDTVKEFGFDFEDVTLGLISGASTPSLIASYDGDFEFATKNPMTFSECTFDVTNATDNTTIFALGDSNSKATATYTVNGGKIVASSADNFTFYNVANSVSEVVFGKGENGAYTLLQLPESVTVAPTDAIPTTEGNLTYSPTATAGLFMLRGASSGIWDIATPANITADGKATFKGMYYGKDTLKLALIAASYVGEKLDKVDFMEMDSITANTLVELTASVDVADGATVKYFLWEGIDSLRPYAFEGDVLPLALVKSQPVKVSDAYQYILLQDGEEKTVNTSADFTKTLSYPDVISVLYNSDGTIKDYGTIATFDDGEINIETADTGWIKYYSGDITDITYSKIYYGTDGVARIAGANLYLYDTSKSGMSTQLTVLDDIGIIYTDESGSASTVMNDDDKEADVAKVLIRECYGKITDIIVYLYYAL